MNLRELLEARATELSNVTATRAADGATTWARGDRAFAVLSANGTVSEFALDGPVAAAAARTPDVTPSARGAGWVVFRPATLDDHAADRARAWFDSGHRRLARG
ncbi:MAG: hypothetical protein WEE50_00300 [Chloroflexota bacterium]